MARVLALKSSPLFERRLLAIFVVLVLLLIGLGFGGLTPVSARPSVLAAQSLDVSADPADPAVRILTVRLNGEPGSKVTLNREVIERQELGYIESVQDNRILVGSAPDLNNDITVSFENKSFGGEPDEIVINGHGKSFNAGDEITVFFTVDEDTPVGIYSVKKPENTADDSDLPGIDSQAGMPAGPEAESKETDSVQDPAEPAKPSDKDATSDSAKDPESDEHNPASDEGDKADAGRNAAAVENPDNEAPAAESPSERRLRSVRDTSRAAEFLSGEQHGDFTATIDTWSEGNTKPLLHDEWDRSMVATFTTRGTLRALEFSAAQNFTQNASLWKVRLNGQSIPFELQNIGLFGDRTHPRLQLVRDVTVKPGDVIRVSYRQDREKGWKGNTVSFIGTAKPINPPQPPLPAQSCVEGDKVWVAYSPDRSSNRNNITLADAHWNSDQFSDVSNTAGPDGVGWVYNGLAFNNADGWLYAVSQDVYGAGGQLDMRVSPGHLLQINPSTGEVYDRGELEGFANDRDRLKVSTGFFGNGGTYYIANSSTGGTGTLYAVNMTTLRLTSINSPIGGMGRLSANDHAVLNDYPQYAWGLPTNRRGSGRENEIERIDLTTGAIDRFDISALDMPATVWGTAWTHSDGTISFGANSGAGEYRLRITNAHSSQPQFELVSHSKAPSSNNNDAASNGDGSLEVDMAVTKEFMGFTDDGRAQWKIIVSNEGPCGSSGSTLTDTYPDTYTDVRFDDPGSMNDATVDAQKHTVTLNLGPMLPNEKRELTVSAKVNTGTECMDNAVTIAGLERDPDAENNHASVSRCLVNVVKRLGDAQPVPGDQANTWVVTYDVDVVNDSDKPSTYGPLRDKPEFASQAKVLSARVSRQGAEPRSAELADDSSFEIASAKSVVSPKTRDSFRVEVAYRLESLDFDSKARECSGERGNGLFNEVELPSGQEVTTSDNSACAPIPVPNNPTLRINKVDGSGNNGPLAGSAFDLYKGTVADLGKAGPVATFEGNDQSSFDMKDLPYGEYVLVEKKAPHNYFLLPKAVGFTLAPSDNGPQVILSDDSDGALVSVASDADGNMAIITVADLLAAELPYTGGRGIFVPLGLGFLVVFAGIAIAYLRRSEARAR